ncbi:MAG: DUF1963 domain-containing protein, partial [Oscillospiraceae bacterium]|nr:DUF1963 domain-containing protein [Oscillospiraceae bacterium]
MAEKNTKRNGWTDRLIPRQTFHEFVWYVLMPLGLIAFSIPLAKLYLFDTSAYKVLCMGFFAAADLCALLTLIGSARRRRFAFAAVLFVAPLALLGEVVEFSTDLPVAAGSTGTNTVLLLIYLAFSIVIPVHFLRYRKQYFGIAEERPLNTEPLPTQNIDFIEKWIEGNTAQNAFRILASEASAAGVLGTKMGGLPYWRPELAFPSDAGGLPMHLLFQVNFNTEKFDDARLPKKGILQFFVSGAAAGGTVIGNAGPDDFRIVFQTEIDRDLSASEARLSGAVDTKETPVTFEKFRDRISASDTAFISNVAVAVNYDLEDKVRPEEIEIRFPEDQYRELCARFDSSGSKILGWPEFRTRDPRAEGDRNGTLL